MKYASFGTVSHGTLRNEDLLASFADELEWQCDQNKGIKGNAARRKLIAEARRVDPESEEADWILNEGLFDALDEFTPPYAYFGALEGDGSDFGFWPSIDALEEQVDKFNDCPPVDHRGECMLVNDHGNVTYGYVNGHGKFKEVWSVV